MTQFFDSTGRALTRAEVQARLPAVLADTVRVVVELVDAQGMTVATVAPEFQARVAATIVAARIIPDAVAS